MTGTAASPYFVYHPASAGPDTETIVFLGGGTGSSSSAQRIWTLLAADPRALAYRVVLPYSDTIDFIDEARRTFTILNEVLGCHGGAPSRVHLAGYSNGGRAAFGLILSDPSRFATLLGTPGLFPIEKPQEWARVLGCRPVFNGVGELDLGWKPGVQATHAGLMDGGVDSIYWEYPDAGHRLSDGFDAGVFFDFWAAH